MFHPKHIISLNHLNRVMLKKLDLFFMGSLHLKPKRLNFVINYANLSNQRSLSPQCNATISHPISSRIGMERVSGRRCPTVIHTINLTFHLTSAATSQQIPASLWVRWLPWVFFLSFITYTLFTPCKNQIPSVEMIIILLITYWPGRIHSRLRSS